MEKENMKQITLSDDTWIKYAKWSIVKKDTMKLNYKESEWFVSTTCAQLNFLNF